MQTELFPPYFNTTSESGSTLAEYTAKAATQDEKILECFGENSVLSASKIVAMLPNLILTSARRSLNTLERQGKIEKTAEKVIGAYGRNEYTYRKI